MIDYDKLEKEAKEFKPKLIVAGTHSYPRDLDYKRFREICDSVGAYLHCDMANISGFVATQELNNPFDYADIVTSTTHDSLRGPRSGLIISKKNLGETIDFSVFPALQGGPHNTKIAAFASQLKQVMTPEYKHYIKQAKANAQTLSSSLQAKNHNLLTNGTDNHMLVMNLRNHNLTGHQLELACEAVNIQVNR